MEREVFEQKGDRRKRHGSAFSVLPFGHLTLPEAPPFLGNE
ncbi:hypothetical protein SRABI83_01946 [Arthrobacter sp. Bi83]|nr:hypothetical protein SRABI83_01946 [Arthrobacter sp. Bi83]